MGLKGSPKSWITMNFFVVSAGLGLLSSKTKIPSYEAVKNTSKKKLVCKMVLNLITPVGGNFYVLPSIPCLVSVLLVSDKDLILISVSSEYLKLIYEDLLQVKSRLIIFTGFNDQNRIEISISIYVAIYRKF